MQLLHGDCREVLVTLPENSVDAIVTDPPAGINFMNKAFDSDRGGRDAWVSWLTDIMAEALRVAKPGAHAFVWALPRTSGWTHRALEDAGWDVRDCVTHLTGQGFPKSLDVSKAMDKAAGAERAAGPRGSTSCSDFPADCGGHPTANGSLGGGVMRHAHPTIPATDLARQWNGWGTALKPAAEFWYLARKPFKTSVAANVTAHGTGALNIAATRITNDDANGQTAYPAHVSPQSVLDAARHIASELRTYSNADTVLAHSAGGRRDMSPSVARYAETLTHLLASDDEYGPSSTGGLDSQDGYPTCLRFGDGLTHRVQAASRLGPLPLADALDDIGRGLHEHIHSPHCPDSDRPSSCGAFLRFLSLFNLLIQYTTTNIERLGEASRERRYTDNGGTNFAPLPGPRGGSPLGRWPANVILGHSPSCREVGVKRVKANKAPTPSETRPGGKTQYRMADGYEPVGYADADGYETVTAWECEENCPIFLLDAQSGERKSGGNGTGKARTGGYQRGWPDRPIEVYGDTGGASRFFLNVNPDTDDDLVELGVIDDPNYLSQDSKTDILHTWENEDQSHNDPMDFMSPARDTFAETSTVGSDFNTSLSGNSTTDPCQTATKSITATETSKTTTSPILNSLTTPRTSDCTQDANCEMANGGSPARFVENSSLSPPSTGTSTSEGTPFTDGVDHAISPESLPINSGDEARFLYQSKASRAERNSGLGGPDGVHANMHPT